MGVETAEAGKVGVPADFLVSGSQALRHIVEVGDDDAGMAFLRRPEVVFDSQVQLDAPGSKPGATSCGKNRGLSISVIPNTPTKKSRAAGSSPRGIANCM